MGSCVPCNGEVPVPPEEEVTLAPEEGQTPIPVDPDGSLPPAAIGEQEHYRATNVSRRRLDGK